MTKPEDHSDTLIQTVSPVLMAEVLYMVKTSTGKPWAEVTQVQASQMVVLGKALRAAYPHEHERDAFVQSRIEDGSLAEGLLCGYLNGTPEVSGYCR